MKKTVYLLFVLSFFILSCGNNESSYSNKTEAVAAESVSESVPEDFMNENSSEPIQVTQRKIIKTGEISFETENLKESRKKIDSLIKEFGAYVSSDNEFNYSEKMVQTIVIRVPFAKFDDFLAKIVSGTDHLDRRNINAIDITEEYVDVLTRIENKKKVEERFIEILKKAKTIQEILEVERKIGELRQEIESAEGRLKYLENKTSFSTLTVTFYEYHESEKGFGSEFSRGFANGWTNLIWFLVGLVNIWPFVIILFLIVWFIVKKIKKRKAK